jgi:hypothetical protein
VTQPMKSRKRVDRQTPVRFGFITEHRPGRMILGSTGLSYQRSPEAMVIQFTEQGRDREQKEALYRTLAERLHDAIRLRAEDLIVSVVANKSEDWSFGHDGRRLHAVPDNRSCPPGR